jgi:protein-S-isoprenylcysteine O-methyltransferase Ste14
MSWRASNIPVPDTHLVGIAAALGLQWIRPWALPGSTYVQRLVGWPLIAAGTYLIAGSLAAAGPVDLEHPNQLTTSGPYAITRNPMYLGWALLHVGAGLARGSGWIVAAYPAVAWPMHREVLREERELGENFGDEFARYRAAVPRYIRRK